MSTLVRGLVLAMLVLVATLLPPSGAEGPAPSSPLPPGATVLPDGTVAVPDVGEAPAWWTEEVREKAREAGRRGLAYDVERDEMVDLKAAYPSQALIRPGTQIFPQSILGWCTAAFAYGGRWPWGHDMIATAGHCTDPGDDVFALAAPSTILHFGRTWTSTGTWGSGIGNDWALIDVFYEWEPYVDADVAWVGGPCGLYAGTFQQAPSRLVKHVGHGLGVGTGGTPRAGRLVGLTSTTATYESVTNGGDSGSPVLLTVEVAVHVEGGTLADASDADADAVRVCGEGRALAIHTHTSLPCTAYYCLKYGTRVTAIPEPLAHGDGTPIGLGGTLA